MSHEIVSGLIGLSLMARSIDFALTRQGVFKVGEKRLPAVHESVSRPDKPRSESLTRFLPSPEDSEVEEPMVEGVIAWREEVMNDGWRPIDITEGMRPLKPGRSSVIPT